MSDDERLPATLSALDDSTCREILEALDEPTSAEGLGEACDLSASTVYRKLDRLRRAGLVERRHVIRPDLSQTTRYAVTFDELAIGVDDLRTACLAADG
ncbi:winged helix-turn-helix domain-containing protein [Halovivax cerinus]|uniref:Helix-turn-helix domain-containing protein n=1 Tax=Halovivax cerinus TaxID=1487865 RepID=A0ABD5NR25_9EURY|nr:helix-turn-helix domain-containing protein [Halovivax cerinus]